MATVKINNKKYEVPELTFRHLAMMEEQGFSVLDAFRKKQIFLMAMGFVCAVTGEDREEAERLLEQHVLGGGDIGDIYVAFAEAVDRSAFFRKMLGLGEEEQKKTKTSKAPKTVEFQSDPEASTTME